MKKRFTKSSYKTGRAYETGRYVLERINRENGRMVVLSLLATAFLVLGFVSAAKNTLGDEAERSRRLLKETGKIRFKDRSYTVKKTMVIKGFRGRILDRNGHHVLAQSAKSLALVMGDVASLKLPPKRVAWFLYNAAGIPEEAVLRELAKKWPGHVLRKGLDEITADVLDSTVRNKTGGFAVKSILTRTYPAGAVVTNLVGLLNADGKPMFGIEYAFNDALAPGKETFETYVDHRFHTRLLANPQKVRGFDPASLDGNDVVLTIDQRFQAITYRALTRQVVKLRAKGGAAVVVDPKTFQVLAMASFPSLDPVNLPKTTCKADDGSSPWQNKVIQYAYEPGSVAKALSLAVALNSGVVKMTDMLDTNHGTCKFGRNTVRDTHYSAKKWIGVVEAMKHSSNCAFGYLGKKMGSQILYKGLKMLGVGQATGVELPFESRGMIRSLPKWKPGITDAGAAYGYGYRVTPLQIARAMAIIANNGYSRRLHIVLRTQDHSGKVMWQPQTEAPVKILSDSAVAGLRKALMAVVEKGGTGPMAVPDGYCVAGKTGTAKINVRGHYRAGHYVATFAGFAPCNNPRIVVVVTLIDPRFHKYGGPASGPVFRSIVEQVLPMMGVAPQKKEGI